jgi:hypothetical protein
MISTPGDGLIIRERNGREPPQTLPMISAIRTVLIIGEPTGREPPLFVPDDQHDPPRADHPGGS